MLNLALFFSDYTEYPAPILNLSLYGMVSFAVLARKMVAEASLCDGLWDNVLVTNIEDGCLLTLKLCGSEVSSALMNQLLNYYVV